MRHREFVFGVLIGLMAGTACTWGLGELRGADAKIREENARIILDKIEEAKPLVLEFENRKTLDELLGNMNERAADELARAKVAQADHGFVPKKEIGPETQKADDNFNAYAGRSQAKDVRRRKLNPKNIARKLGAFVSSIIPWWAKAIGVVLLAGVFYALYLRFIYTPKAKKRLAELQAACREYDDGIETMPADTRRDIGKGPNLQREHAQINQQRKNEVESAFSKLLPGLKDEREVRTRIKMLGEQARHKDSERLGKQDG